MKITLNMLIHKLKEIYPEIRFQERDAVASLDILGVRIFPENRNTLPNYLYLSRDKSCLSHQTDLDTSPLIYVCRQLPDVVPDSELMILQTSHSMAELFNTLLEIYGSFLTWDRNVHEALIRNQAYTDIMALSNDFLHNPILLYDLSLKLLAHNGHPVFNTDPVARTALSQGYLPGNIVQILSQKQIFDVRDTNVIFEFPSPAGMPHKTIYLPFLSKGVVTGYCVMLMVECDDLLYEKTMFRNFYEFANIAMNQLSSGSRPNEFVYEYFLLDLINNPDSDPSVIREHCSYAELPYTSDFYYMEFQSSNYSQSLFSFILHQMRTLYPSACAIQSNETIVLLIYQDSRIRPLSYKQQLEKYYKDLFHLAYQYSLIGAVASSFREIPDIRAAHQQTSDVLSLKISQAAEPSIYYFEDEYLNLILSSHNFTLYGKNMLPPSLKEMYEEDQQRNTQNIELLKTYFAENCNITQTAQHLSMHRNNVVYHLRRLETHYGLILDDAKYRLLLQLYLELLKSTP